MRGEEINGYLQKRLNVKRASGKFGKVRIELRESSEGKMAMISVGNYPQKRGKYHGRQWILFDSIGTKPYNNTLCITWPILGGELSVVA